MQGKYSVFGSGVGQGECCAGDGWELGVSGVPAVQVEAGRAVSTDTGVLGKSFPGRGAGEGAAWGGRSQASNGGERSYKDGVGPKGFSSQPTWIPLCWVPGPDWGLSRVTLVAP